jgi:hypothetical protein
VSAKSLLFTGDLPYSEPVTCRPGRQEIPITLRKNGRLYKFVVRDKISIEDPYTMLVKASAFAIGTGEPYAGQPPARAVRDFLIKSSVVI